jgi:uncharacterized membrane protein
MSVVNKSKSKSKSKSKVEALLFKGLSVFFSIPLVSYFIWSVALDSPDLLLLYSIIAQA